MIIATALLASAAGHCIYALVTDREPAKIERCKVARSRTTIYSSERVLDRAHLDHRPRGRRDLECGHSHVAKLRTPRPSAAAEGVRRR